jgi:SHS2 domain-containing protein
MDAECNQRGQSPVRHRPTEGGASLKEGTLYGTPVNPVERPPYRLLPTDALVRLDVEGADWPHLVAAAALALSDAVRPVGSFDTWTARRVAVRGATPEEVLERWLGVLLSDLAVRLPAAIVEIERAEPTRAAASTAAASRPTPWTPRPRPPRSSPGSVVVEVGDAGRPRAVRRP